MLCYLIRIMLQETAKGIQIFGITETHLNKSIKDKEIKIDGYEIIRNDRKQGSGGGVCVFVRNDMSWLRRTDLENDKIEAIWIEIFPQKSKSILICFLYRPPDTSSYLSKDFDPLFDDILTTANAENKEVIFAGDLNCNRPFHGKKSMLGKRENFKISMPRSFEFRQVLSRLIFATKPLS